VDALADTLAQKLVLVDPGTRGLFFSSLFPNSQTKQIDAKRHAFQENERRSNSEYNGWDYRCTYIPAAKFDRMMELLRESDGKLVIKSPPGSGKTTLAQAFCKHLEEQGYLVYFVSLLGSDKTSTDDFWKGSWAEGDGVTFKDVCNRAALLDENADNTTIKPIFVVIDETQKWYLGRSEFWELVKKKPKKLHCVFFAAYGGVRINGAVATGSPADVGWVSLYFDHLQLDDTGIEVIAKYYSKRNLNANANGLVFFPSTRKLLRELSSGHARIVRGFCQEVAEQSNNFLTEEQQLAYLASSAFFISTARYRPFYDIPELLVEFRFNKVQTKFTDLLLQVKAPNLIATVEDDSLRVRVLQSGLFVSPPGQATLSGTKDVQLLCPMAFDILITSLLSGTLVPRDDVRSFMEFLITSFQRMDPRRLWGAIASINKDGTLKDLALHVKVLEDFFQKEFYRALTTVIAPPSVLHKYVIQTNVGKRNDGSSAANKQLDVFINDELRWAVELLQNGDRLGEHIDRFAPGGDYTPLKAKHAAVVDFRQQDDVNVNLFKASNPFFNNSISKDDIRKNLLWRVVFSMDFKKVTIVYPDHTTEEFQAYAGASSVI